MNTPRSRILLTGGSGFVGSSLAIHLKQDGRSVRSVQRIQDRSNAFAIGDIGPTTDWFDALADVNCIVHCAARAHVMNETKVDPLAAYRRVNVGGTRRLAEQAAESGVKRLVYLSSIKVNGEQTSTGTCFTASAPPNPIDPYGISKWEAEQVLFEISARTGLEVVIIRPSLVYGPGVKGNFLSLLGWLNRGIPLPLGAINNMRSLVGIDNLVDLVSTCIDHPAAVNQTFLVSDGEDLSITDLLQRLGRALHKPSRLLPVPASMLEVAAQLVGKKAVAQRLLGNLQVDISKTREVLDWNPPVSVDEGLQKTADWFLSHQ